MLSPTNQAITFWFFFKKAKLGVVPSSAPTIKVARVGSNSLIVNGAPLIAALLPGMYYYKLSENGTVAPDSYYAVANTADSTVDDQDVPSLWVVGEGLASGVTDAAGEPGGLSTVGSDVPTNEKFEFNDLRIR